MTNDDIGAICLLRAVNVGGRNKVPMAALREALARNGIGSVTTLLASGNLLVPWSGGAEVLGPTIEAIILETFDVATTCLVVQRPELVALLREPFSALGALPPSQQLVITFDHAPVTVHEAVRDLDSITQGSAHLSGRFVIQRCPGGISNAPALVPFLETRWGVVATARNRRTIDRLLEATP
jgi:uncharacterized protein (DUF1697 family)